MTPQAGGVPTQEIELNPVRAGLCANPNYDRYCGYAKALAKGSSWPAKVSESVWERCEAQNS